MSAWYGPARVVARKNRTRSKIADIEADGVVGRGVVGPWKRWISDGGKRRPLAVTGQRQGYDIPEMRIIIVRPIAAIGDESIVDGIVDERKTGTSGRRIAESRPRRLFGGLRTDSAEHRPDDRNQCGQPTTHA